METVVQTHVQFQVGGRGGAISALRFQATLSQNLYHSYRQMSPSIHIDAGGEVADATD
jgi:hypothetical protein